MNWFDPITAKWQLRCPQNPGGMVAVGLTAFRRLQQLAGPQRPPVYQVVYWCDQCNEQHTAMLTADQLDLEVVACPTPVYWNLMSGKMDWHGQEISYMWSQSIARGRWPINLWCNHQQQWAGGWPSLLKALEPDHPSRAKQFLVHYNCPACQKLEANQMSAACLNLKPIELGS